MGHSARIETRIHQMDPKCCSYMTDISDGKACHRLKTQFDMDVHDGKIGVSYTDAGEEYLIWVESGEPFKFSREYDPNQSEKVYRTWGTLQGSKQE